MRKTIIVVGGALAGPAAASRAREIDESANIILIERNKWISYAQGAFRNLLRNEVQDRCLMNPHPPEYFARYYNIDVWTEAEVLSIDAVAKEIAVTRNGALGRAKYDALIYALGAATRIPAKAPAQAENLVCFRTLGDLEKIVKVLESGNRRVAVLGGGPFGIEAADGLAQAGAEVTLIEQQAEILPHFSPHFASALRIDLQKSCKLLVHTSVSEYVCEKGLITKLRTEAGAELAVDFVVVCAGLTPRSELLASAGARCAADGSVVVDRGARTSLADVFACGVCVAVEQATSGSFVSNPQASFVDKLAQVAGMNAAGMQTEVNPALGTMLLETGGLSLGRCGLSRTEGSAKFGEKNMRTTLISAPSVETLINAQEETMVGLLWHAETGAVLGVELAGKCGVAQRLDAAAAALSRGVDVQQLAMLELGYTPRQSPVRDPLNVAGSAAMMERQGLAYSITAADLVQHAERYQCVDLEPHSDSKTPLKARELAFAELRSDFAQLNKAMPTVLLSENGQLGWLGCRLLNQVGFVDVAYLAGGKRSFRNLQ